LTTIAAGSSPRRLACRSHWTAAKLASRQRKLYCREVIARFAHNLALNWNIGEENTQSTEEIVDM